MEQIQDIGTAYVGISQHLMLTTGLLKQPMKVFVVVIYLATQVMKFTT